MNESSSSSVGQQYFIRIQGKILGPFSLDRLKSLALRGQFARAHEVSSNRQSWSSASTLEEIFPATTPTPASLQSTTGSAPLALNQTGPAPKWYYNAAGVEQGPVTIRDLKDLVSRGELGSNSFIWKDGMDDWAPLSEIPELKSISILPSKTGKAKTAAEDAYKALAIIATNPVGGLSDAFERLGNSRALGVGLVFALIFALCQVVCYHRLTTGTAAVNLDVRVLLSSLVPFLSLSGVCFALRLAMGGRGSIAQDCFLAGAALMPAGLSVLLASLLGLANFEVIVIVAFSAFCLTILMLYGGLTKIFGFSERLSSIAVPLMLIATVWLCKIIFASVLSGQLEDRIPRDGNRTPFSQVRKL